MIFEKDASLIEREIPYAYLEVRYPEQLDPTAFYAKADEVIAELKEEYADYDRKALFGENPYFRFFKKFKKTYPVMLQFESFLLKDRPFPHSIPVVEVPFLAEVKTLVLMGTHDIEQMDGTALLFSPTEKIPFSGLRGEEVHTYPNDVCARDGKGIILSMIAGADDRTGGTPESRHVFYPLFGTPGQDPQELVAAAEVLKEYVQILSPEAEMELFVL